MWFTTLILFLFWMSFCRVCLFVCLLLLLLLLPIVCSPVRRPFRSPLGPCLPLPRLVGLSSAIPLLVLGGGRSLGRGLLPRHRDRRRRRQQPSPQTSLSRARRRPLPSPKRNEHSFGWRNRRGPSRRLRMEAPPHDASPAASAPPPANSSRVVRPPCIDPPVNVPKAKVHLL
jgi:hypothetical protein